MAGEAHIEALIPLGKVQGWEVNSKCLFYVIIYHPHREGEYSVSVRYPNGSGKPVRHFKLVA